MYTNLNGIIYASAYVSFLYTKPLHPFTFPISASIMTPTFVLFWNYFWTNILDQYFHTQKESQIKLYYRFCWYYFNLFRL